MFIGELLVAMPVFVTFLWAVIEFGMFFSNMQSVALASRVGAEAASEVSQPADPIPNTNQAIYQQLVSSGITSYLIRVESQSGVSFYPSSAEWTAKGCQPTTSLSSAPAGTAYVRVSVCVPLSQMMPNLLVLLGFDVDNPARVASHTTVLQHE